MSDRKTTLCLLLLTLGAFALNGYHPFAEDAEIYLPGIEKALHPYLFPSHAEFFQTQSSLTLFPHLIAGTVRWIHLPFADALLFWQLVAIFLLLFAAWKLASQFFGSAIARWGAVALLASLLTLPVAGTALYVMDQYINPRNFAAFGCLFAVGATLEGKLLRAVLWVAFAIAMHPLMGWFALSFSALWLVLEHVEQKLKQVEARLPVAASLLPTIGLFAPSSPAYHQAAQFHGFHYLRNWEWYEWLGIIGPILIFWRLGRFAESRGNTTLARTCRAFAIYELIYFAVALVISVPERFESLARVQPLRSLHLLYMVLIIVTGGLIAEHLLKNRAWRWGVLFLPLCGGMFLAQRSLFPASSHIEWPWATPSNRWQQAFVWIQENTPQDAVFAMDPLYIKVPGEDTAAFRPIAERSSLADGYKDSGTVSMFPALAGLWWEQFQAQKDWKNFSGPDFLRLRQQYGVNWLVLQSPGIPGMDCPYRNPAVLVCRVGT